MLVKSYLTLRARNANRAQMWFFRYLNNLKFEYYATSAKVLNMKYLYCKHDYKFIKRNRPQNICRNSRWVLSLLYQGILYTKLGP